MDKEVFDIAHQAKALDDETKDIRRFAKARRPETGWIRKVRRTIGMTGRQLAARMNTKQSRVSEYERHERAGTITLAKMDEVAKALGGKFVYAIVPENGSTATMVQKRITHVVNKLYAREKHAAIVSRQPEYVAWLKAHRRHYILLSETQMHLNFGRLWRNDFSGNTDL